MHVIDPLYSLSGFGVGLLVGMTGVGGGSLMTPLLILLFGIHLGNRGRHGSPYGRCHQNRRQPSCTALQRSYLLADRRLVGLLGAHPGELY